MIDDAQYPPLSPANTGLKARCPRCGQGRMFSGYLSVVKECAVCKLDFDFADSGDGPAVFIMMIVGLLIVGGILFVEVSYQPPYWLHAIIWLPLAILLPLLLLRPAKGLFIAVQFSKDAAPGRLAD